MNDYGEYLKSLHSKLTTPDEVTTSIVFEATKKEVKNKRKIIAGEASEVYDVELTNNSHVILRIARGEKEQYGQESWAINEAKKVGVPVPEILLIKHLSVDGNLLSFCVQNKLPGEPLERGAIDFGKFDKTRQRSIINNAGEILSKIHQIKTNGFGYLKGEGKGSFATFGELMSEHANQSDEYLKLAKKYEIPEKEMAKTLDILSKKAANASPITPILCHNDFNIKHIMVDGTDRITGIIDWGEVQGDSPVSDFAKWDYWFGDYIPTEWLKEGYPDKQIFSGNYEELFHWIRLNNGLGVMYWYDQKNYVSGIEFAKEKLLADLKFY